ncbi:MAG: starch-binding protein, partial [Muribaculaceae bacterium]|nr:starch-binding protein [Muribaculaceae bacterium]
VNEWKGYTADWWAMQNVPEGAAPLGNMLTCAKDPGTVHNSDNVFMKNGAWHEPDYSDASGFNVIDFPMHYNFNNAGEAVKIAKEGDHFYNDASWNVVYVDSHDYCPGPNDGVRFNGGTAQWAENLSLMFSFRGIPCIYYGSEVEFQKGKTIDKGTLLALHESGRAYYGAYLEGTVNATDFGTYTASGNVAKTLNADLAQHIRRLNQIRAAVPALRKGQYTFDGCSAKGGFAFKRAYKDSYALVAVNGGATFTNVPAGTYVDLVTGKSYNGGGTITVDAPATQGQLRVLVKGWTGGKVGEDGKYIYATSPVAHGGAVTFEDPGTDHYYTAEDAPAPSILSVKFNPGSGTFRTETLSVNATLSDDATSGWYQIAGGQKVNLAKGASSTFEIGRNMNYGESVTVSWGATGNEGKTASGKVTYKKVDPNASITVYVKGTDGINIYAWGKNGSGANVEPCGAWPGKTLAETTSVAGDDWYYVTFDDMESVNVIFNKGDGKTGDITGITSDSFFTYTGGNQYTQEEVDITPAPTVRFSPNGGEFTDKITVTATVRNASSAWYRIGDGNQTEISGTGATFTLGENMAIGETVTVSWSASGNGETRTGAVTYKKIEKAPQPTGFVVYYDNSVTNWSTVKIHYWGGESATEWPGSDMNKGNGNIWYYTLPEGTTGVVFNNGAGDQTNDVEPETYHIYKGTGNRNVTDGGVFTTALDNVTSDDSEAPAEYYNMQGMRVDNPS